MRNFIENCNQLNGMAARKKAVFAKRIEDRMAEPADLNVSHGHFMKWLDRFPPVDRYVPPADIEALRREALEKHLVRIILEAWEMVDGTASSADSEASLKFDARVFAEGLMERD